MVQVLSVAHVLVGCLGVALLISVAVISRLEDARMSKGSSRFRKSVDHLLVASPSPPFPSSVSGPLRLTSHSLPCGPSGGWE